MIEKEHKLSPAQQRVVDVVAQQGVLEYYSASSGRFRNSTDSLISRGVLEEKKIDMFSVSNFNNWSFVRLSREAAERSGVQFHEWPRRVVRASDEGDGERGLRRTVEHAAMIIREKLNCTQEQAEEVAWAIFEQSEPEEEKEEEEER